MDLLVHVIVWVLAFAGAVIIVVAGTLAFLTVVRVVDWLACKIGLL